MHTQRKLGNKSEYPGGWFLCYTLISLTTVAGCQSVRSQFQSQLPPPIESTAATATPLSQQPAPKSDLRSQPKLASTPKVATAESSTKEQTQASESPNNENFAEVVTISHEQPLTTSEKPVETGAASEGRSQASSGLCESQQLTSSKTTTVMTMAGFRHSADVNANGYCEPTVVPEGIGVSEVMIGGDPNCFDNSAACMPDCGGCVACQPCAPQEPCRNAQEYIFDGGDQLPTVVVRQDGSTAGIDPTDTVVYYETDNGTLCVLPSNRVPIYAPRFGAVRQVTGAFLAAKAIGTQRILAPVQPGRLEDINPPTTVMQPVAPVGEEQVHLIDAFRENVAGTPIASVVPPERLSDALIPHEGIDVLRTGRITDEEILVMGRILQNARTWFVPESIGVIVEGQEAHLMIGAKKPQDVHVFDIPDKCTLRICKTASHTIANSGDIVNFTIRFDNVGTKPVRNIVIVDSLSPRLEYVEGSQQSSVETRFTATPNDVGSEELRWEIDVIDKVDGGVISFDCRVR